MAAPFFTTPFQPYVYQGVLQQVRTMLKLKCKKMEWKGMLSWMIKVSKGKTMHAKIKRAVFLSLVYHTWYVRNAVIFQAQRMSKEDTCSLIWRAVCLRNM